MKKLCKILARIAITVAIAFIAFGIIAMTVDYSYKSDELKHLDSVVTAQMAEIASLRKLNEATQQDADRYKARLDELDAMIERVRSKGYKPDVLVLRYIQIKSQRHGLVPPDFIMDMIGKETSWANRTGTLGEVGYTQTRPETVLGYLKQFGIPIEKIDPRDYEDCVTNLDWTYFIASEMRIHLGPLNWKDWNELAGAIKRPE